MTKPNILIVMTDHQRWDTVLPENPCISPNIEAMAREGVRFDNMHAPMAHCCPARASFMSG
ncbi:MAG: sulfatase-like hydrolase/transferase, partial [Lentisphaerae bacterium]|nr:sulfatase-like hydrolase/transferase [Lentisphaerota bacterium]